MLSAQLGPVQTYHGLFFYFYRITLSATIRSSENSMASFNERGFPDAAAHFPGNGNPVRYRPGTGLDWPDYSMGHVSSTFLTGANPF